LSDNFKIKIKNLYFPLGTICSIILEDTKTIYSVLAVNIYERQMRRV